VIEENTSSRRRARVISVQPTLAARGAQRPEGHGEMAARVPGVADGDEHHVALVALKAFHVLDEERLGPAGVEERLELGRRAPELLELQEDRIALRREQAADAERQIGPPPGMLDDRASDSLCLDRVDAAAIAHAPHVTEGKPEFRVVLERARRDVKSAAVEFTIGKRDQARMSASIVPGEHAPGHAPGAAQAEKALELGGA